MMVFEYEFQSDRNSDSEAVALSFRQFGRRKAVAENRLREIKCLSEISHDNIVTFYGISKNSESITVMLLELADCGSLHDCLYMRTQDWHLYSYEYSDSLRWMHHLARVAFLPCQCICQNIYIFAYCSRAWNICIKRTLSIVILNLTIFCFLTIIIWK